jgi:hypothetical protein
MKNTHLKLKKNICIVNLELPSLVSYKVIISYHFFHQDALTEHADRIMII